MLIPNWKDAWKWLSVQIAAVGLALQGALTVFPTARDWVGDENAHWIGLVILAGIVMGRIVDQSKPGA